jgi:hypothetical protein
MPGVVVEAVVATNRPALTVAVVVAGVLLPAPSIPG